MSAFDAITPKDIVVANCLPLTEKTFLMHKTASLEKHEYAKNYCNWSHYNQVIGNYLASSLDKFEKLEIRIIRELTISQWGKIFNNGSLAVLLISHWQDNHPEHRSCIELSDGFISIEEVVDKIPLNRKIIIDLCICHPIPLVDLINEIRPEVRIVYRDTKVLPNIWLLIYLAAFFELYLSPTDYATSIERSIANLAY